MRGQDTESALMCSLSGDLHGLDSDANVLLEKWDILLSDNNMQRESQFRWYVERESQWVLIYCF